MAIPCYKNITGATIDVPVDSGTTQRVPPGYFVKGKYFIDVFDAHTTTIDGVTKTFKADPSWTKTADWTGLSAADKAKIIVDNLEGYGNRLQLVDVPATTYDPGFQGEVALDGTTIYLCTETGTDATTPTVVTNEAVGTGAASPGTTVFTLAHVPTSVTNVKVNNVAIVEGAGAGKYTRVDDEITFGTAVVEQAVTATYTWSGPYPRWFKGTIATW